MTDEEWQKLNENFETHWLLEAVDLVDNLRGHLGDGEHFQPPEIRSNLLKLHGLAMEVINNGWDGQIKEMAELAFDLEEQTLDMKRSLAALHRTLSKLTQLLPESALGIDD